MGIRTVHLRVTRRRAFVFLFLLTACVAIAIQSREPRYDGVSAGEWFKRAESIQVGSHPQELKSIADAFRSMGPDGVSFLIVRLQCNDTPLQRALIRSLGQIPVLERWKSRLLAKQQSDGFKQYVAVNVLSAIGPAAEKAVPALTASCADRDSAVSANSATAIRHIAAPETAIPILTKCLSDGRPSPMAAAAFNLYDLADNSADCSAAIPALRAAVARPHEVVWFEAARALSRIDGEHSADLVMARAVDILQEDPNKPHFLARRTIQIWIPEILGNLGTNARAAVPCLLTLETNRYDTVREAARRAISKIDPTRTLSATP